MPFTAEELRDLIRLVEAHPEWRAELRRLVLTDELLALPEQVAAWRVRSEQQFQELIAAQRRTDAQVAALADAQRRTDAQIATLTGQLEALTARVDTLVQIMQTLTNDVAEFKGKMLEADYRTKGPAYFGRLIRRPHVLTSDELITLVENARDSGILSDADAQALYEVDVIVRGRRAEDRTEVYLVVEVSWGVGPHDVERAAQRAALLAQAGFAVMPVVAGKWVTPDAVYLAHRWQVWQLTDGRAIPPEPAVSPS